MQISSLVDIIDGELLNTPSISFVTQIQISSSKVSDGDLFISNNKKEILEAVKNGAFSIVSSKKQKITDNEIAWINVKNIDLAMVKIIRFKFSNKCLKSFYCDNISYELLEIYSHLNKNLCFLSGAIKKDFKLLQSCSKNDTLFSTSKKYMTSLVPQSKKFNITKYKIANLTNNSLFSTSFSYGGKFYDNLKLPNIYINNFIKINKFYNEDLDLNMLKRFSYFKPIFINKNSEVVDFGKSNRFILSNINKNIAEKEIKHLNNLYKYGKIIILRNSSMDNKLYELIKESDFNALYLVGNSWLDIINLLTKYKKETLALL